jgi:D-glycero-D-manno-heptose 1,7-bisphosphate phosphatase
MRKAVFLDRDGVLNRAIVRDGKPYPPSNLSEFEILSDSIEACEKLKEMGYSLVVATNQPDVGRGTLEQSEVEEMHTVLLQSIPLDRIEVCYHPGRGLSDCICRKPLPGMLLKATEELNLDLNKSWMIGDRFGDIQTGKAAGVRTILIGRGYNEEAIAEPDFRADNLSEAVSIILNSCSN